MSKHHTNQHFQIRTLEMDDISAYVDHLNRNLKTSGLDNTPIFAIRSRHSTIDHITLEAELRLALTKNSSQQGWKKIWTAWDDQMIVGATALMTDRNPASQMHRATLGAGIELKYRHMGLGKTLLQHALEWATTQSSLKWIDLGVFALNAPARRLYEAFGFVECGRLVDAFRVDNHIIDDIQMVLDLDQIRQKHDHGKQKAFTLANGQ